MTREDTMMNKGREMSLDAMKQALEALEFLALENFVELDKSLNVGPTHGRKAIIALRAAIEQAQGLAEKIPAKGTLLEQTLGKVWDEMPHTALMDALVGGTGVMLGDKRIDPASIYKQPKQEPRQWQGLTDDDIAQAMYRADAIITGPMQFKFAREIEAKLKEKNNG